jgi:hypothetical protein
MNHLRKSGDNDTTLAAAASGFFDNSVIDFHSKFLLLGLHLQQVETYEMA